MDPSWYIASGQKMYNKIDINQIVFSNNILLARKYKWCNKCNIFECTMTFGLFSKLCKYISELVYLYKKIYSISMPILGWIEKSIFSL